MDGPLREESAWTQRTFNFPNLWEGPELVCGSSPYMCWTNGVTRWEGSLSLLPESPWEECLPSIPVTLDLALPPPFSPPHYILKLFRSTETWKEQQKEQPSSLPDYSAALEARQCQRGGSRFSARMPRVFSCERP